MKSTLFISHASEEDDTYFAVWLASKLKLLGYHVWLDVKSKRRGGSFWSQVESVVRNDAVRFLALVTRNYADRANEPQSGVLMELSLASNLARENPDFIVPLRAGAIPYSEFPIQLGERDAIDASSNWGEALRELVDQFRKDGIPVGPVTDDILDFWFKSFEISTKVEVRQEHYWSNLFEIQVPESLYVHRPDAFVKAELAGLPFPFTREGDRILSFFSSDSLAKVTIVESSSSIPVAQLLGCEEPVAVDSMFSLSNPRKQIVRLLNKSMTYFLRHNGLRAYSQSYEEVFYYPDSAENRAQVSLKHLAKTGRALVGGKQPSWHYAIRPYARLEPKPHYAISHHVVFTSNGWPLGDDEQHRLRRSQVKDWYNRDWLERMLAMMTKLSDDGEARWVHIPVDYDSSILVSTLPWSLKASVGYVEPS